ncbi:hypothetical protein PSYMO_37746, partial [Pseudomonas amygdali pv. mori str. 301020]
LYRGIMTPAMIATLAFGWLKIRKHLTQQASSDIPAG